MSVTLNLPMPPSANNMWTLKRKGLRLSPQYEAWLNEAGWLAKAQRAGSVAGRYELRVIIGRRGLKKTRRDLDNLLKPISDLLVNIGTVQDDSLCEYLSAEWEDDAEGVTVKVEAA